MTRVGYGWCVATVLGTMLSEPVHAQRSGTLELAGTVVEYDGFLVSGAAALTPEFRYDTRNVSLAAHGTWVTFESGNHVLNGTLAAAWLSSGARWRTEVAGAIGGSAYTGTGGFGHAIGRARLHYRRERSGAWAGIASGATMAGDRTTPFEISVGTWRVYRGAALAGDATFSTVSGIQYLDLNAALRWTSDRVRVDVSIGARPLSNVSNGTAGNPTPGAYGDVAVLYEVTNRIAASIAGGRSRGDPIRHTLAATYLSLGLRLNVFSPPPRVLPVFATAVAGTARAVRESPVGSTARLTIDGRGPSAVLIIEMPTARTVEIMADFTDWSPTHLTRLPTGEWELRIPIDPGAHRLNIRVNGGAWLVPLGSRLEQDEYGGAVGVIVIR